MEKPLTLDELENSLPNGLHDAYLVKLGVDYAAREACFDLDVHVGEELGDETYRPARITFTGVQLVVIDPPAVTGDYDYGGISRVDSGMGQPETAPLDLPPLPNDCFLCWLFVSEWNRFVRIAARSVSLAWLDPGQPL